MFLEFRVGGFLEIYRLCDQVFGVITGAMTRNSDVTFFVNMESVLELVQLVVMEFKQQLQLSRSP